MRAGRDLIARAIDGLAVERAGARILPIDTCAALESSVYDLLTGIDLITVHGSYEHLSDAGAAASTAQLFGRLAPGGRLLIAHVGPDGSDRAYLEACMNWWMTCRDENALDRLMAAIPDDEGIRSARAYRDPSGGVVVFEVVRGQASGTASAPRRQQ